MKNICENCGNQCKNRFCSTTCYWSWMKGRKCSPQQLEGLRAGWVHNSENLKKWREAGNEPWNKGREWKEMQKENHPNWKGGKTELSISVRMLFQYKQWRKSIFERDNWTCVFCGRKRKIGDRVILHADHIYPFCCIMRDNNITSLEEAKQCKELWDTNNGRTLCIECHKKTETYLLNQYTVKNFVQVKSSLINWESPEVGNPQQGVIVGCND